MTRAQLTPDMVEIFDRIEEARHELLTAIGELQVALVEHGDRTAEAARLEAMVAGWTEVGHG